MRNRQKNYGFTVVEGFLLLVIAGLIGLVGWYVWNARQENQNASIISFDDCVAAGNPVMESYPEQCATNGRTFTNTRNQQNSGDTVVIGNVTFKNASNFSEALRNEIITKVTDPLNYFHTEIVKIIAIKSITVNTFNDEVYAYEISYKGLNSKNSGGFLFGERDEPIGYWYPQVCDDTVHCPSYLQEFKKKFPKNYEEYQKCETQSRCSY